MNRSTAMHLSLVALTGLTLLSLVPASPAAEPPKKIKVLLVTGDDVGAHPWYEVSQAIRETLLAASKFDVKVSEDPGIFESAGTLKNYDVVFLHLYNATLPTLTDAAKQNLLDYVKGGKGLCISHLSSASFKEWSEFRKLCGRYWVMGQSGHGPRSVFKAQIADQEHPITKGLTDFETDDELYGKLQGDAPMHVLVSAASDWSKTVEPLAFTLEYGQGRVFHETFGHDGKAIKTPNVSKLIQRGTEWAATGKVE
ncbi:MAG: ThuA domain-containing protein [Verrucomicrobia bacterium]|nr:ThuA domain-containing protein [Verrucomicrobiota bacterium]